MIGTIMHKYLLCNSLGQVLLVSDLSQRFFQLQILAEHIANFQKVNCVSVKNNIRKKLQHRACNWKFHFM